jgi:hypothetical protein
MLRKYLHKNELIMKKIYVYMVVCVLIGVFMIFRQSIRYVFMEDLNTPTALEVAWVPPGKIAYEKKILLELHHFNPQSSKEFIAEKIIELKRNNTGIQTLVLNGSPKIDTNTYMRALATFDWGIEEIRVHNTAAINIYAFINLIKSCASLKRVVIRDNKWNEGGLAKIRKVILSGSELIIIKN